MQLQGMVLLEVKVAAVVLVSNIMATSNFYLKNVSIFSGAGGSGGNGDPVTLTNGGVGGSSNTGILTTAEPTRNSRLYYYHRCWRYWRCWCQWWLMLGLQVMVLIHLVVQIDSLFKIVP